MRLLHYADNGLQFDPTRTYNQTRDDGNGKYMKPRGFWVSVEGEDDWKSWCLNNNFGTEENFTRPSEITLSPDANILYISSPRELDLFHAQWSDPEDEKWYRELNSDYSWGDLYIYNNRGIKWAELAQQYDGIIIAPYQWTRRMVQGWYYSWDCASGCIWNLSAITSVDDVAKLEEAKRRELREMSS